ncbi:hypothetical protein [Ferrimicrobium sp.]|uniref:hypothetical protein n=1 Tax=Ferrimicrobium sp. TaxID=2926050 RepID=UPI00262E7772|nr:hypothetical protein [Ferrimicrobium sp.]
MVIVEQFEVLDNDQVSAQYLEMPTDATAIITALADVGVLIVNWYPNAHFGCEEVITWTEFLTGYDPGLFVPTITEYAKHNPDWPPSAPKFRMVVEELTRLRSNR